MVGKGTYASVMQRSQSQFFGQLSCSHCVRKILFVGKHQNHGISQLVFVQHVVELAFGLDHSLTIVGIDYKDESLCVLEIVTPQGTDLVLALNKNSHHVSS